MNSSQRFSIALTLCIGWAATSAAKDTIRQPTSVLPWQYREISTVTVLDQPALIDQSHAPTWLLENANPLPQQSQQQDNLPMVEKENFAHLGQLNSGTAQSTNSSAAKNRVRSNRISQPSNLLRMLGIKASRPDSLR